MEQVKRCLAERQELDGKRSKLVYDGPHKSVRIVSAEERIQWMYSFCFAWYAFRPHTEVFTGKH